MPELTHVSRIRLSALSLSISGILFVLYPAIRPFSDEGSLKGAAAFASTEWLVAHMLAMVAFTLLPLGLLGLYHSLQDTAEKSLAYSMVVLCMIGTGLTLPFYGGEAYGLHAIGQEALRQQSTDLVSLADVVRSGPGLIMFVIGILLTHHSCNYCCDHYLEVRQIPEMERHPFCFRNGSVHPAILRRAAHPNSTWTACRPWLPMDSGWFMDRHKGTVLSFPERHKRTVPSFPFHC